MTGVYSISIFFESRWTIPGSCIWVIRATSITSQNDDDLYPCVNGEVSASRALRTSYEVRARCVIQKPQLCGPGVL